MCVYCGGSCVAPPHTHLHTSSFGPCLLIRCPTLHCHVYGCCMASCACGTPFLSLPLLLQERFSWLGRVRLRYPIHSAARTYGRLNFARVEQQHEKKKQSQKKSRHEVWSSSCLSFGSLVKCMPCVFIRVAKPGVLGQFQNHMRFFRSCVCYLPHSLLIPRVSHVLVGSSVGHHHSPFSGVPIGLPDTPKSRSRFGFTASGGQSTVTVKNSLGTVSSQKSHKIFSSTAVNLSLYGVSKRHTPSHKATLKGKERESMTTTSHNFAREENFFSTGYQHLF